MAMTPASPPRADPRSDPTGAPDFSPAILDAPKIGGINPALRQRVHQLVESYPQETIRVIREWMTEGPAGGTVHRRH